MRGVAGNLRGMNVLILGSGGREHALALACATTAGDNTGGNTIFTAPGNPGTAQVGTNLNLDEMDGAAVVAAAHEHAIDLVIVGPEAPLVAGVAEAVRAAGIPVFGPDRAAAQLEGSKSFAKEIMAAANVPTAAARTCTDTAELEAALDEFGAPYVVKDDGLAGGKGVVVTTDRAEALAHGQSCLEHTDGRVVIEEYLDGPEVSLFCISDGNRVLPLAPAQDYKRIFDGQTGPNTGGMGAYSPLPWASENLTDEVIRTVAQPTIAEMARRGEPFIGLLYCGLALTSHGLRVVEFNVRFGDPETQVVLPRLATPLADVLYTAATGNLPEQLLWRDEACVCVVISGEGYPGKVLGNGRPITGIAEANALENVHVIHAGTAIDPNGQLVENGGRVLGVVALGEDVATARERAYAGVNKIQLQGSHHRNDIAVL